MPVWKKILLAILVTAAFFVLLELGLAALGVKPRFFEDDPYVGFSAYAPLFVPATAADGTPMLTTAPNKLELFNDQAFPRTKAAGARRVFCLGGSTAYGHPYDDTTSFCGWLRRFLAAADPEHSWEVINAAGISYASYREAKLMEELKDYQPDLFILYTGHNEFLERRTYGKLIAVPAAVRGLGALASRTRTYTVMRRALESAKRARNDGAQGPTVLPAEVNALLDEAVGPVDYTRDDGLRDQVFSHFHYNLARMVDIAHSVDAEVILVVPPVKLRDCAPFKSEHRAGLDPADETRWRELATAARTAYAEGRPEQALAAMDQANAIDDRHAHAWYFTGQVLDALGRFADARRAYERARDEDVCPLRAPGPVAAIVAQVGAERGLPLVDFRSLVEQRSPNGIPGESLFLDHVHPTIEGHKMLALALLDVMVEQGMVRPAPAWNEGTVERITQEVMGSLDDAAQASALTTLSRTLGWAGKLVEALALAERAVALDPGSVPAHYQAGLCADLLGRVDEAMVHYQRAVELDPSAALAHGNLAVAYEKKGDAEGAVRHHRLAIRHGQARDLPRYRSNLARLQLWLGFQAYSQGRFAESVPLFAEAAGLQPDNAEALDKLGTALLAVNRPLEAAAALQRALRISPTNAAVRNRLAVALYLGGRSAEAVAEYRRAVADDPRLADAPDGLVNYLRRAGRGPEAQTVLAQLESGG